MFNMALILNINLEPTTLNKSLDMEAHTDLIESFRELRLGWVTWQALLSTMLQVG